MEENDWPEGGGDLVDASHLISGCERWSRFWWVKLKSFWDGTLQMWGTHTIPRIQKESRMYNLKAPCLSYRLVSCFIFFSLKWSETVGNLPFRSKKGQISSTVGHNVIVLWVSFRNKLISVLRRNQTFATFWKGHQRPCEQKQNYI